jgi:hypothetical protein
MPPFPGVVVSVHRALEEHPTRARVVLLGVVVSAIVTGGIGLVRATSAPPLDAVPGQLSDGSTLLPNGWRVAPAGRQLPVGDLPLSVLQSPDGRYLIITNNGLSQPSLMVVDIAAWTVKSTTPLAGAWYGLAWHPDGTKLYAGEANQNAVEELTYANGVLTPSRTFLLPSSGLGTFAGGSRSVQTARRCTSPRSSRRPCRRSIWRVARYSRP